MTTVLNVDQFQRFMAAIKKLGDRVQREHDQFLRDSQRIEDRSALAVNGTTTPNLGGRVNFESLVGGGDGATVKPDTVIDGNKSWDDDDIWGSIFSDEVRFRFKLSTLIFSNSVIESTHTLFVSTAFHPADNVFTIFSQGLCRHELCNAVYGLSSS